MTASVAIGAAFPNTALAGPAPTPPPPGQREDTQAKSDGFRVELEASEQGGRASSNAKPVADGYPRDANGREYTCTVGEPITDPDHIRSRWHLYPGGLQGQPIPEGGTIRFVDCTFVDESIEGSPEGVEYGYQYFAPPWEQDLQNWLLRLRETLEPPEPRIRTWPSEQFVVGVATRFRVENFETKTIEPPLQTPSVWAQATITPTHSVWTFKDKTLTCNFAGKPFVPGDDAAKDRCQHTFHHRTDGFERATVVVHYAVTWESNRRTGVQQLPPIQSDPLTFDYAVRGYEAVIR